MGDAAASLRSKHRWRALVTRPRAEAEALADALQARDVDAVVEPLLDIRYHDAPIPPLAGIQALLCTSANGVRALARSTEERAAPLLAVGEATAAAARAAGFRDVASADGAVDDLIGLALRRLHPDGGRLLHAAGSAVAGDLAAGLRRHGFSVERVVLYDARPATRLSDAAIRHLKAGAIDVALFFSPRTAMIFARLAATAGLAEALRPLTAISLSAAADAALTALPFGRRLVAARPHQAALLQVLDQALAERARA